MDAGGLQEVLLNLEDESARSFVDTLIANEKPSSMIMAVALILDDNADSRIVEHAVIFLRQVLHPTILARSDAIARLCFGLDAATRGQIRSALMRGLMFDNPSIRSLSAVSLSYVAKMEVDGRSWPSLFDNLGELIATAETAPWSQIGGITALRKYYSGFRYGHGARFINRRAISRFAPVSRRSAKISIHH
jgi:hypothetical protein